MYLVSALRVPSHAAAQAAGLPQPGTTLQLSCCWQSRDPQCVSSQDACSHLGARGSWEVFPGRGLVSLPPSIPELRGTSSVNSGPMTQGCFREVGISRKRLCPPETSGSTAAGQEAVEAVSWTPPLFGAHTFVPPLTTDFTGLALHTLSLQSSSSILKCSQFPEGALSSLFHLSEGDLLFCL